MPLETIEENPTPELPIFKFKMPPGALKPAKKWPKVEEYGVPGPEKDPEPGKPPGKVYACVYGHECNDGVNKCPEGHSCQHRTLNKVFSGKMNTEIWKTPTSGGKPRRRTNKRSNRKRTNKRGNRKRTNKRSNRKRTKK